MVLLLVEETFGEERLQKSLVWTVVERRQGIVVKVENHGVVIVEANRHTVGNREQSSSSILVLLSTEPGLDTIHMQSGRLT